MAEAQPVPGGGAQPVPLPETWAIGQAANPADGTPVIVVAVRGPYSQLVLFLDLDSARKIADDLHNAPLAPGLIRAADLNGKPKPSQQ